MEEHEVHDSWLKVKEALHRQDPFNLGLNNARSDRGLQESSQDYGERILGLAVQAMDDLLAG